MVGVVHKAREVSQLLLTLLAVSPNAIAAILAFVVVCTLLLLGAVLALLALMVVFLAFGTLYPFTVAARLFYNMCRGDVDAKTGASLRMLLMWILLSCVSTFFALSISNFARTARMLKEVTPGMVLGSTLICYSIGSIISEIMQIIQLRYKRYVSMWNSIDILRSVSSALSVLFCFSDMTMAQGPLAIGLYLWWIGVLYYMQAYPQTAPHVRMLISVVHDIRYFSVLLIVVMSGTAFAFHILLWGVSTSGFSTPSTTAFSVFNMLLLGSFTTDDFAQGRFTMLLRVFFTLSALIVPIILLNLLIAIMSDSYERVQDKAVNEFYLLRARIICNREAMEAASFNGSIPHAWAPVFVHVLRPILDDDLCDQEEIAEGQGMLYELRQETRRSQSAVQRTVHRTTQGMCSEIAELREEVAELRAAMQEIRSLLLAQSQPKR